MKNDFKKQYRDLETRVLNELRSLIGKSKIKSKHVDARCIKVDIYNYKELCIVGGGLNFLDSDGLHYSVFAEATLEDLIDLLEQD